MDSPFTRTLKRIPPQLRERPGTRFTVILSGQKRPEGKDWGGPNGANYAINDPPLAGYLSQGHNYGVLCGHAGLAVVDLDDLPALEELDILQKIPETFQVRTGRDGRHNYFDCPELDHQIGLYHPTLKDEDGEPLHLGEIQSRGQQIVCPGSIHANGNRYEVVKDVPITTISKADLLDIFNGLILTGIDDPAEEPRRAEARMRSSGGHGLGDLIPIDSVAWPKDVKEKHGSEVIGTHPVHSSRGGKNFAVNTTKNSWHCFRHGTGGGPLEWLAVDAGLIGCEDAKPGCLDDKETFKTVLQIARDKGYDIPAPEKPNKEPTGPTVIDAVRALDSVCDHAATKDGNGFSKFDREAHEALIEKAVSEGNLDPIEEKRAYGFLKKYKKQLKGLGIDYEDIGHIDRESTFSKGGASNGESTPYEDMCDLVPGWIAVHHFKTMADNETIYRYKDGVYVDDGARVVKELAESDLGNGCDNKIRNEAVGKVQRQTYVDRERFNEDGILNLKNGLLDLETGTLMAHSPDQFSTIQLPVEYNTDAVCPAINKFLDEVLDPEDRTLVEEILGWMLWPAYSVHKAVMLVGSGRNGKGALLRLMAAMLGRDNISDVSLQQLCDNRFMPARLYGKMANLGGDLPAIDISDTASFKGLTGGDRMTVENKYGQPFEFDNRAKLIFSTNKLPKTPDDSYAYYSRWILMVFRHVFDVQRGTGDEGLDKKLQTPEELSGLLNIALAGLSRLHANGWKFSYSKTAEDVELLYKRMASPIVAFLMDECEEDPDGYIEKTAFYNAFKDYSQKHSIKPISPKKFWSELKDQSEIPVSDYRPDNFGQRYVKGVKLNSFYWGRKLDCSYWGKPIDWIQDSHDDFAFSLLVAKSKNGAKGEEEIEKSQCGGECKKTLAILASAHHLGEVEEMRGSMGANPRYDAPTPGREAVQ